jgi:hypothetical protein
MTWEFGGQETGGKCNTYGNMKKAKFKAENFNWDMEGWVQQRG